MEVQHTATITVPLSIVGVKMLRAVAAVIESNGNADVATGTLLADGPAPAKKPRGRPKKEAKPEADDFAEEPSGEDDLDLGEELEDDSEAETDTDIDALRADEAPKKKAGATAGKPAKVKALTLEDDIIPAFRDYAKEHGRPAAAKLVQKFKVNSVRDIPVESYPNVLKLLRG